MELFNTITSLISGIIVMSIIFGLSQIVYYLLDKVKVFRNFKDYSMKIVALIFFIVMYNVVNIDVKVNKLISLLDIKYYLYIVIIVIIVANIIAKNNTRSSKMSNKEKIKNVFDGITMEVPQRLFMQTFLYTLTNSIFLSIILNSIVWCTGIFIQSILIKQKKDIIFFREEISSFIFSIGIGYVYAMSECIILSMIAHSLERYLTQYIRERRTEV